MVKVFQGLFVGLIALLALSGCDDPYPPPINMFCSINGDGSHFTQTDNSLKIPDLGKAFYISDELVFHLGSSLSKQNLISREVVYLSTGITDNNYLAIDKAHQVLYFAAGNAICKIGFSGENFTIISPSSSRTYSAPALSDCGNYLTAIRDRHIMLYNILSGEWSELPDISSAVYAVYISNSEEYYFFSQGHYLSQMFFCRTTTAAQDSTMLMEVTGYGGRCSIQASANRRFFAMQYVKITQPESDAYYGWRWKRHPFTLRVYDRIGGSSFDIPDSFCFTFVENDNSLIYSHLKYGMADLIKRDLITGSETMIWDGYYEQDFYSYSISEIYPRSDGQKLFLDAWKRSNVKISDDKAFTGPDM